MFFFFRLANEIPLSTLAAILIKTGYRLTNPKRYYQLWQEGYSQFIPFVATVLAIVLTDLGWHRHWTDLQYYFHLAFQLPATAYEEILSDMRPNLVCVDLANQVTFSTRSLQLVLYDVPPGGALLIDASNADYIDPDVIDLLSDFQKTVSPMGPVESGWLR